MLGRQQLRPVGWILGWERRRSERRYVSYVRAPIDWKRPMLGRQQRRSVGWILGWERRRGERGFVLYVRAPVDWKRPMLGTERLRSVGRVHLFTSSACVFRVQPQRADKCMHSHGLRYPADS